MNRNFVVIKINSLKFKGMKFNKLFILLVLFLISNELIFGQRPSGNNPTFSGNSNFVEYIYLNSKNINNYLTINNQTLRKKVVTNKLIIDGINENDVSKTSFRIRIEKYLKIKNCSWNDVNKLLNIIDSNSNLESIAFENIKFLQSKNIRLKYKNIKNISFSNCDSLSKKEFLNNFCNLKKINRINMIDNKLKSIPNLNFIEVDSLFLSKNPKIKPENDLKKLPIKLKYLKIDNQSSAKNSDLKNLLPNISISFDTTSYSSDNQTQSKRKHGVFKVSKQDMIVYSGAYTYFASFIQSNPYNIYLDTLLFDQRFDNLQYKRLVRNNTFVSSYRIKILSKRYNKNLSFQLIDNKYAKKSRNQILNDFPEYNILKNLIWVLEKPVKKTDFLKKYGKRHWHDFRISYSDINNSFTITFKDDTSFFNLVAKPLLSRSLDLPNKSMDNYQRLYLSYEKKIDQRRLRFNNKIAYNYQSFKKAKRNFNDSCWMIFSNLYLSEDEKKMEKEDWFKYYENIIADEKNILNQSASNQQIVNRALQLIGIKENTQVFNNSTSNVRFKLIDSENRILSVNNATIIDLQNLSYMNFQGGFGFNQASLFLMQGNRYVIYAELLGGDIALVKAEDITFNTENISSTMLFKATVIEKELNSLEQVLTFFNLKL
jgi:hypothetical protein